MEISGRVVASWKLGERDVLWLKRRGCSTQERQPMWRQRRLRPSSCRNLRSLRMTGAHYIMWGYWEIKSKEKWGLAKPLSHCWSGCWSHTRVSSALKVPGREWKVTLLRHSHLQSASPWDPDLAFPLSLELEGQKVSFSYDLQEVSAHRGGDLTGPIQH
jgi:hypothetical protein